MNLIREKIILSLLVYNMEEGGVLMKLTNESLEFAKNHITKYSDSDFYPKSKIFDYLWKVWDSLKTYLLTTELSDLDTTIPKIFAAPNQEADFGLFINWNLLMPLFTLH